MNLRVPEYRCGLELATATRQPGEGTGEHCRPSKSRVTELNITSLTREPTCHLHPSFEGHSIADKRATVAGKRRRVGGQDDFDRPVELGPLESESAGSANPDRHVVLEGHVAGQEARV